MTLHVNFLRYILWHTLQMAWARSNIRQSAVVYLAVAALAGGAFVFCSFWVYHYVDLEHGGEEVADEEAENAEDIAMLPISNLSGTRRTNA